jgi:hypothetical protein
MQACALLIMPLNNPIPAEASLSCLALALAALSSSMRIFGDEMQSFRREAATGCVCVCVWAPVGVC